MEKIKTLCYKYINEINKKNEIIFFINGKKERVYLNGRKFDLY